MVMSIPKKRAMEALIWNRENRAVLKRDSREDIILMTYGVSFFGQESVHADPLRSIGGNLRCLHQ